MSDLHTSLVETYLHMRNEGLDPVGKEETEIDEGVYGRDNKKLRSAKDRSARSMTPAMRAKQKREAKRAQELEDKGERVLAGLRPSQVKKPKPETPSSDTPKAKVRKLAPGEKTDPLDDLIKRVRKESYSNWRQDLRELVDTDEVDKQLTDKKKIKNKVTLNPEIKESVEELGGILLEMNECDVNDYIDDISNYLYENEYSENDIESFLEEYSTDDFMELLEEIDESIYLNEARRSGRIEPETKTGKSVAMLKGGAKTSAIKRLQKLKQQRKDAEASSSKSSGMTAALKRQSATATAPKAKPKAEAPQAKKRSALDRIAGAVLNGIERHKNATATAGRLARETGDTIKKAASTGAKVVRTVGSGAVSGAKDTATAAKKVKNAVVGEESELDELNMPKMKKDLRGAGEKLVTSFKAGVERHKDAIEKRKKRKHDETLSRYYLAQSFSPEDCELIEKKLADIENKKMATEAIDAKIDDIPGPKDDKVRKAQSDAVKRQQIANQKKLLDKQRQLEMQRLQMQRKGLVPMGRAFESNENEDSEVVSELNRYEKEKGVDTRTGRPITKGGTFKDDPVMKYMMKGRIGKLRVGANQGKKVPGKKPPTAGEYGSERKSPEQIVKTRRAQKQHAKDMMHSRFD